MKNLSNIFLIVLFFQFPLLVCSQNDNAPHYFELLSAERPNIYKIMQAYDSFYKDNKWIKNDYTRAYNSFMRSYPIESFDLDGFPILPSNQDKKLETTLSLGNEWRTLPVRIERSDCYYTGQNGVIRSLAVDPSNSSVVFAGGMNGGIWKSTDKGLTWSENLIKNLPHVGLINKIVIAPSNTNYIYVASNAGVLRSTDGGTTFSMTSIDYTSAFPSIDFGGDDYRKEYMFLDVSSTNENVVIASDINPSGLVGTVAISNNGGQTWTSNTTFGYKKFTIDVRFHPTNSSIAYTLVFEDGDINFYRSTDGGLNFTKVTNGFANYTNPNNKEIRGKLALSVAQPDLVTFFLNVNDEGATFYKSINAGVSWSRACCGTASGYVNKSSDKRDFFGEGFSAVQIRWATAFAISNVDPDFVAAATNVQPRFSFDQMESWYWTGDEVDVASRPKIVMNKNDDCGTDIHGDIQEMLIVGNDVWVANDGGIALSEDGGITFKERADGIPVTMALGFDMTPGERDVIAVAMDHNGVMVKDVDVYGNEWKPLGGGDASGASVNPVANNWLYARPSGDNIINRPVSGISHGHPSYESASGINFGSGYLSRFNNVQFHPNHYYTLYTVDYNNFEVKKSIDNGGNWTTIKSLQSGNGWSYAEVKVSESNPQVIYVSDESGGNNTLDKSTDGGITWTSVLPNLASNEKIRNIEIDGSDENVVWLTVNGSSPKVYKSINGGASWSDYSTGLSGYSVYSMVHQKGSNGGVYVGTKDGVYYRDNNLSSWTVFGTNMPGIVIKFLKINYYKGIIRAGTGRGIWETELYNNSGVLANFSANATTTSCSGDAINFASTSIAGSDNLTYSWVFEGGVPSSSNAARPSVIYPLAGSFNVSLTVTNSSGTDVKTTTDFITVSGTCSASEEIALTDVDGLGNGACISTASPVVSVYNKGLPLISTYTIQVFLNDVLEETRSINTSLASGSSEEITFNNLSLLGVSKVEFVVSNPNGNLDDTGDNTIESYIPLNSISVPLISTVSYSSASGSDTPDKMFDGDEATIWHNNWGINAPLPHEFVFDFDDAYNITGLEMLNRQNNSNGMLKDVEIYTSSDGVNWSQAYNWTFDPSTSWQTAYFGDGSAYRYLKFIVTSTASGSNVCSIAEMKFKGCDGTITFVNQQTNDNSISIFPNPTQDYLMVEGIESGMNVQIVNALGLLVYEGHASTIPVVNYNSGIYYLQITDGEKVIVKKWMKL